MVFCGHRFSVSAIWCSVFSCKKKSWTDLCKCDRKVFPTEIYPQCFSFIVLVVRIIYNRAYPNYWLRSLAKTKEKKSSEWGRHSPTEQKTQQRYPLFQRSLPPVTRTCNNFSHSTHLVTIWSISGVSWKWIPNLSVPWNYLYLSPINNSTTLIYVRTQSDPSGHLRWHLPLSPSSLSSTSVLFASL